MNSVQEKEKLRVLIADDEPLARSRLVKLLSSINDVEIVGEAANGQEVLKFCRQKRVDTLLLDIEMPGMNGLEAAAELLQFENSPAIVFCTAYDDFALEAFERSAVDYLLKPIALDRLKVALDKAQALTSNRLASLRDEADATSNTEYLWFKSPRGKQRIELSKVRLLRAESKYVIAVTDETEILLDGSLASWEQKLEGSFVRLHRATLVSAQHFSGWEKSSTGGYRAIVDGIEEKPIISRRHMPRLQERFKLS